MAFISSVFKLGLMQRCFIIWLFGVIFSEKKDSFNIAFPFSVSLFVLMIYVDNALAAMGASSLSNDLLLSVSRLFFCVLCITVTFSLCCKASIGMALFTGIALFATEKIAYDIFLLRDTASFLSGYISDARYAWLEFVVLPCCFLVIKLQFLNDPESPGAEYTVKNVAFACALLLEVLLAGYIRSSNLSNSPIMVRLYCINESIVYIGLFFIFSLYESKEKFKRLATTELMLRQDYQRQHEMFEQNTDRLNHKFHDFKHVISALHAEDDRQKKLLFIRSAERDMAIFDSKIKTGNQALDTILTGSILTCDENHIQWTCMADGTALEFMDAFELCRLIGNTLDNAIESVLRIDEEEKRFIAVNIWRRDGLSFIKISNYCAENPVFENGIPLSTKLNKSEHGYGMQSIKAIIEQYGGHWGINIEDGIFTLSIMFPVPQKASIGAQ